MSFSAVKHFLCSAILGAFCITFLSGCIAMVLERPLSEANEFQDKDLDGVWLMTGKDEDSKAKPDFVFAMEDVDNHHYSLSWMFPNRTTFTVSQIPDGKNGSYRFASITFDEPGTRNNAVCMLVRYAALSTDEIGVYNVTKELQDAEDYRKLCTDPEKKDIVTAGPDAVRKWCARHAEEMELIFKLKRVRFKSDAARRKFLDLAKFFHEHTRRIAVIVAESKEEGPLSEEQQRKIRAEFEATKKWLSESKDTVSPELAVVFESYLSMPVRGRLKNDVAREIDSYTLVIRRIAYLQLLK